MADDILRKIGEIAFSANSAFRLAIPAVAYLKNLRLRFSGLVTVSGGTTNGTLNPEQPLSLLKELSIEINGRRRKIIDGATLYQLNRYYYGAGDELTALASAGTQTNTPITFALQYDFAPAAFLEPDAANMCMLDTRRFPNTLHLVGLWGSTTDLISGGDRTVSVTGTLTVDAHDVIFPSRTDIQLLYDESTLIREVTADNDAFTVELARGGEIAGLFIKALSSTITPDDSVINHISVIKNTANQGNIYLREKIAWQNLKSRNKLIYGLESVPTGYAMLDLTEDYSVNSLVSTEDFTRFDLQAKVVKQTGTNYLRVTQLQIIAI